MHGAGAYRTQSANMGGHSGLLGIWWCCCGDEWVARRELALAMVTAEAGKSSAATAGEEGGRENANGARGVVRAGAGEVKARAGLPWPHAAGRRQHAASAGHHAAARL